MSPHILLPTYGAIISILRLLSFACSHSTPARRTRKVSTNGLTASSSQVVVTVNDTVDENPSAWVDDDGRQSAIGHNAESSSHGSHLMVPGVVKEAPSARSYETPRRPKPLSPELFEPLPQTAHTTDALEPVNSVKPSENPLPPTILDIAQPVEGSEERDIAAPPAGPSKLKTLQLLARRPFNAFGKKVRGIDVSWWPSRSSQGMPDRSEIAPVPEQQQANMSKSAEVATRRSEDMLSKASPRVCDTATLARNSRSMELSEFICRSIRPALMKLPADHL